MKFVLTLLTPFLWVTVRWRSGSAIDREPCEQVHLMTGMRRKRVGGIRQPSRWAWSL